MRRSADSVATGEVLATTVAIVGAGPMGIVTALELANRGVRVLVMESGSVHLDPAAQLLNEGESGHEDYYHGAKSVSVRRQVGGTSALWGGRCVPFDRVDFDERAVTAHAPWPLTYDEIDPYMGRACAWAVCGRPIFNALELPELAGRSMVPGLPDGDVRTTDLERWSLPTRFGQEYGDELDRHPNIDLITGLTCVGIECSRDGSTVDHLQVATADGRRATVTAREFILAPGGLEATRLLLASKSVYRDGIGNESGHLGRYYMSHVQARVAELHLNTPPEQTIYEHERDAEGVYVRRRFSLSREFQTEQGLPNAVVWLVNPDIADHRHGSGILSGVYLTLISPVGKYLLAEAIRSAHTKAKRPTSIRAHLRNIAFDLVPALRFAVSFSYARFVRRGRKAPGFFVQSASNVYPLHFNGEHLPHRESRVELSDETDALGLPRLRTHVHFSDADLNSPRPVLDRIDAHLREHGVGHIEYLYDEIAEGVREFLGDNAGFHQAGTTRMSLDPADGVVDPNLMVHGVEGLYVVSTSVLPTSSHANPTLLGIALGVRLAERLAERSEDHA